MTAIEYLDSLIAGQSVSSIPVQASELAMLRALIVATAKPEPLTDERIDNIADITIRGMENGIRGFMTAWGWRHFARNLLDACGVRAAPPEPVNHAAEFTELFGRSASSTPGGEG